MVIPALRLITLLLALGPLVYYLLALYSVFDYFRTARKLPPRNNSFVPPASILKPVRGLDEGAYENFASYCRLDYPHYEMVFAVADANDPIVPVIEKLQGDFPDRQIRLVTNVERCGQNSKVNNLCRLVKEARYDLLVMTDSDVRVETDYLREVAAPFADPAVGAVTSFYRCIGGGTLAAALDMLGMSADSIPSALVARKLEGKVQFAFGWTMATTKKHLAEIGGWEAMADYHSDDFELGNRIARQGHRVEFMRKPVWMVFSKETFGDFLRHEMRWSIGLRNVRPAGYAGMIFTHGLPWAALAALDDAQGIRRPAPQALKTAKIKPLKLESKEGLALINGTDGMLGMLVLACADAERLFRTADVTAAMSAEALLGTDRTFQSRLHEIRPHPGQVASAANLARLMRGSKIVASHRDSHHAIQDSYSVRCSPQVAGAARDTLEFARRVAEVELSSAIDNPVVLEDGDVESNGNFHGEPLAFAADFLAIAAAEVGSIAERRVDRLLDPHRSEGLPPFLAEEPGVNSGLMVAQYTAAALVAENRRLASPASVDSVPTSGMQEDHVSMGWGAAQKLRTVLENLAHILAVELVAAARAQELRRPLEPSPATAAARNALRKRVSGLGPDRVVAPDLSAANELITTGAILQAAESVTGPLQ